MPIHPPGEKFRYHRILSRKKGNRDVVAILSLTAMVDMFTVLVIFLLQNYNTTGEVIYIPKEVVLPKAASIKELKPAVVVTISSKEIIVDKTPVIDFNTVKNQEDWTIQPLLVKVSEALAQSKIKFEKKLENRLKKAVEGAQKEEDEANAWSHVTIQADKGIDFLTVKKIMYTVREAGAGKMNFAVTKEIAKK